MVRLKAASAFLWIATALGVLHPYYRQVGHEWLTRLGLPDILMWLACAGELVLGVVILASPPRAVLMALQVVSVSAFTLILARLDPMLLAHPYGILSKNAPFGALVIATWLVWREGWTQRAWWTLRGGMALVWVTEGLLPKVIFQQPFELDVVANSGLVSMAPSTFLMLLGIAQFLSGVLVLVLRSGWLRAVLICQAAGLAVLPLLVSWQDPMLWLHPFGPMIKNVPILVGTLEVLRRCRP